jgi:hypothetical protein
MTGTNEIFAKRVYNTYPYIVIQKDIYNAHLNENLSVYVNLKQKDNLFGDTIVLNLAGLAIIFKLYDINNNLIARSEGSMTNVESSEIAATIDSNFITKPGIYYGYFTFTDLESNTFTLPLPNNKTKIKISYN